MIESKSMLSVDNTIHSYVIGFVDLLKEKLKSRLVGVYLHGSLAMGSFFPPKSDMDFIIVIDDTLDVTTAKALNRSIAEYAEKRPTVGSIECSIITAGTARNVPEQIPYELHYSDSWHKRILDDEVLYGIEQVDSDLPAHLMCVKKRGICLYGKPFDEAFGDVSWQSFWLSVLDDFNWIVDGENICDSPYYGVLNICRILQIRIEQNEQYLSKYEGAIWGMENLPSEHHRVINKALEVYTSDRSLDERERKTGGVIWDETALMAFRDYASMTVRETDEERRARIYPIILREYNPAWPEWYTEEKSNLEKLLGDSIVRIQHIGSTAVPGLMAKPTVDILLEVPVGTDFDEIVAAFSPHHEYICLYPPTNPEPLCVIKGYTATGFAEKVFHIHVREMADYNEPVFRDYLTAHPEAADEYAALKRSLFQNYEHDRDGYTNAKGEFVKRIVKWAKEEKSL